MYGSRTKHTEREKARNDPARNRHEASIGLGLFLAATPNGGILLYHGAQVTPEDKNGRNQDN
jgi:hypothetical protein